MSETVSSEVARRTFGFLRGAVRRTASATVWGLMGGVLGAAGGAAFADPPAEDEVDDLARKVQNLQMFRHFLPWIQEHIQVLEYGLRRRLEELGYFPCSVCGGVHTDKVGHQMPPGTYWSEEDNRYVAPDDPTWTQEGYEAAAPEDRWDLKDDTPDDDDTVH